MLFIPSLFLSGMRSIPLLFLLFLLVNAGKMYVRVRGRASCQSTDEKGVVSAAKVDKIKVELWERDNGENAFVDADDLIDSQIVEKTEKEKDRGIFTLEGGDDEPWNEQEFYVKIYFPCVVNSKCNFVKYKKYCEKNPGGYYMAKKYDIPEKFRFVHAKVTFPIDYRMGYAHHEIDSNIPYL